MNCDIPANSKIVVGECFEPGPSLTAGGGTFVIEYGRA